MRELHMCGHFPAESVLLALDRKCLSMQRQDSALTGGGPQDRGKDVPHNGRQLTAWILALSACGNFCSTGDNLPSGKAEVLFLALVYRKPPQSADQH